MDITKRLRSSATIFYEYEVDNGQLLKDAADRIEELETILSEIGAFAHDASTGPAVLDAYWSIRDMAYRPLETDDQTNKRIKEEAAFEQ